MPQQAQDIAAFMLIAAGLLPAVSGGTDGWDVIVAEQADNASVASAISMGRTAPDFREIIEILLV